MNDVSSSIPATQMCNSSFFAATLLPRALGFHPLMQCYQRLPLSNGPGDFACRILDALSITTEIPGRTFDSLPVSGPLLLASNHPFGAADGLIMAALCTRVRPDLKILVNHMLYRIPELRPLFIPVNVFKAKDSKDNIPSLRAALLHLKEGGALAVFPSGVVSHWHMREKRIIDPEWNSLVGRMTHIVSAPVVPLYFEGHNSLFFQAAGCVHPIFRTILLPRELWHMRGRKIRLRIGEAIEPELMSALRDDKARTAYIRSRCYALGWAETRYRAKWSAPIATPRERKVLLDEIRSLPPERVLAEEGKFRTLYVDGKKWPHIMHEIGRLREITFRSVHEGSGKALDIDSFDPHYIQIVLWDEETGTISGGYRVRCLFPHATLKVRKTLYTASLFHYKKDFFTHCGISMELGRAFITPEYQRDYAPLLMLWKGIGHLAAMAGARTLFGASSIGLDYTPESVFILRQHLEEHYADPNLAAFVQGRRRPKQSFCFNTPDVHGLEYRILDRAVKGLEGNKGLPILFKHYLQMGGRIAAFHEDLKFGTLDALMVVDLATAPEKLLLRYMGKERLHLLRIAHNMPLSSSKPEIISSAVESFGTAGLYSVSPFTGWETKGANIPLTFS